MAQQSRACPHHKSNGGSRGIAPLILNLCTGWRWVVNFRPRPLYPAQRTAVHNEHEAERSRAGLDVLNKGKLLAGNWNADRPVHSVFDYTITGPGGGLNNTMKKDCFVEVVAQSEVLYRDRLAKGWTVRGSNTGRSEIYRTHPDRTWGPPNLLYKGCRVYFRGVNRPGCGNDHSPPFSAELKKKQSYLSTPPLGLHCVF